MISLGLPPDHPQPQPPMGLNILAFLQRYPEPEAFNLENVQGLTAARVTAQGFSFAPPLDPTDSLLVPEAVVALFLERQDCHDLRSLIRCALDCKATFSLLRVLPQAITLNPPFPYHDPPVYPPDYVFTELDFRVYVERRREFILLRGQACLMYGGFIARIALDVLTPDHALDLIANHRDLAVVEPKLRDDEILLLIGEHRRGSARLSYWPHPRHQANHLEGVWQPDNEAWYTERLTEQGREPQPQGSTWWRNKCRSTKHFRNFDRQMFDRWLQLSLCLL